MKQTKQKLAAVIVPIITLLAGYFGYQPIQEARQEILAAPDVDIEVIVPEQKQEVHSHSHSHNEFKELAKEIKQVESDLNKAIEETMNEHKERWH